MSQKIKNPNQKGNGFVIGLVALVAVVVVVIGAVVFIGRSQPIKDVPNEDVNFSVSLDGDVIRIGQENAKDAKTAVVFEDFSCHYCADMSNGGHADELQALNDGKMVIEQRTLNFLDGQRVEDRDGHSTRAYAIARMIAESGNAKAYWNYHNMLMQQQKTAVSWDNEELAKRLEQLGVDAGIVEKVRAGVDLSEAQVSATANSKDLEKRIGSVSSPHVFVNDKDVLENISGAGGLESWVKAVLG
nr:thioredoxin domain-containing protein [Corynebacterium lactis]